MKRAATSIQYLFMALIMTLGVAGCGGSEDPEQDGPDTPPAAENDAEQVVNIYSSRHYDTDDALFAAFTEQTGIKVNVIEDSADALLARIDREGELSPADIFVAVDAGRLQLAVDAGVLSPVESAVLSERIPASLRHPDGLWFGMSKRVRCIYLGEGAPADFVTTYAELADPKLEGLLLIRSSSNIYNQSLVASRLKILGEQATQDWVNGIVSNLARTPQGGDTDQLRALAAGEGRVAVANHYYYARMIAGDNADDNSAAEKIRLVFPDQDGRGAHVNVSGAGVVATAPNRENAIKLLEFMTTREAQRLWALKNHEFPVVEGIALTPVLEGLGTFKSDNLNAAELGENNREAVRLMDRAGWR